MIVTNNIPSGDGGSTVLLALVGAGAFLLLAAAIVFGMMWFTERRRRTVAEDTVVMLTGQPMGALRLAMTPPVSTDRLAHYANVATPSQVRQLER